MAKYPFDERFKKAVYDLSDWDGEGWYYLLNFSPPNGHIVEALTAAGYSESCIQTYVSELLNMPPDDLFKLALKDDLDYSPALNVLQRSDSRAVCDIAIKLSKSRTAKKREIAILTLMRTPGLTFKEVSVAAVVACADLESDESVLSALGYAMQHLDVENCSGFLKKVAECASPDARMAAAYSLGSRDDEIAVQSKIVLSRDTDDDVRNWATFGLHLCMEEDSECREDVANALCDRVTDPFDEAKYEAIEGLSKCKDPRVIQPLIEALEAEEVWDIAIEAAERMGDPALYPSLIKLREWWKNDSRPDLLERAIVSCSQNQDG